MPCYEPPPTPAEEEAWAMDAYIRREWNRFYHNVTKRMLEQWLCDALRGNPAHPHCTKWWELHQQKERDREG